MTIFVPGKLRNPLNGSWGGWRKHARLAKDWRERTAMELLFERLRHESEQVAPNDPKTITFTAHVGAGWDDDNLPAAIKPIRDALVDAQVIHSDAPDSGHVFRYAQVVDRTHRGVEIVVLPSPPVGGQPSAGAGARRISADGP